MPAEKKWFCKHFECTLRDIGYPAAETKLAHWLNKHQLKSDDFKVVIMSYQNNKITIIYFSEKEIMD